MDYLGFLISQVHHVEEQAYMVQYPDIQYRRLVPVDTSAAEWARGITHFSTDKVGDAAILNHAANNMPVADVTRQKHEVAVEMAGIGYQYTNEELGQAMLATPGVNLSADRAMAAVRASEEYIDNIVLRGSSDHGWDGLINQANVDVADAVAGSSGNRDWARKTPDEIIRDVNDALTGVWSASRTVELADTIALPVTAISHLANTRIPDTNLNIRQWIEANNLYTAQTGQPLNIVLIRGLETAATSNSLGQRGTGRMIAYRNDMQVLRLHMPMPHRFFEPFRDNWMTYLVPGAFRLGGLEIRRPGALRYVDGIVAAPS